MSSWLGAKLRVSPNTFQLGEDLREEAWLGVNPQHWATEIRSNMNIDIEPLESDIIEPLK